MVIRTDGAGMVDKTKLTIPLFKKMFRALYISRSRTRWASSSRGVPMLDR